MPGGKLPRHDGELVILRIAHLRGCDYEWDHHVRIGRRIGVTDEVLDRVRQGPEAADWPDRHRALLRAVDQLVATKAVDDASWGELAGHFDQRRLIEILLLVTQYDGLATTVNTLGVPRDTFRRRGLLG
jgi:AhpD family alkylhydroperoxidase